MHTVLVVAARILDFKTVSPQGELTPCFSKAIFVNPVFRVRLAGDLELIRPYRPSAGVWGFLRKGNGGERDKCEGGNEFHARPISRNGKRGKLFWSPPHAGGLGNG